GLKSKATPAKHANVLTHIMGFFKEHLAPDDKQELLALIDQHRQGLVPVVVPITLINHYLRKFPTPYIERQIYLEPHPKELMLRNQI
ncbi:MAG: YbgA family protein, partial [Pseudomonadales bacterium]|nr:YbgA family protein [Pseudomonadales bacterium]